MDKYILRDAGDELDYPTVNGGLKTDKVYPRVNFDIEQLPEIGNWDVGGTYLLVIQVKQLDHSIEKDEDGVEEQANFEIQQVGAYKPEVDTYGDTVSQKLKFK